MFLGILTLFVAISISVIAAYYSILGLTAIFAAAFLPIVLMGSVLEVGKILATVWLHIHWRRAPFIIKTYLTSAVIVLMFITSMGVFGFLSKSHIEQSSVGTEQIAQAQVIDQKIARAQAKQTRWADEIARLQAGETSGRVDALIERERERIADARNSLAPQIKAENNKIPGLREQAEKEVAQQNKRLSDAQRRSADAIAVAQAELDRLDADVTAYTKQGNAKTGAFGGTTDMVAKGNELRKQQRSQRRKLQGDIDKAKSAEVSVASAVQREIKKINNRLAEQIKEVEARIADIRKTVEPTIASANENIAKYTTQAGSSNKDIDLRINELEAQIDALQPTIDTLREDKFVFEKNYRQFEAEVGPVKYIAELIYGVADRSQLEEAVRWVIIIIVAVFDPLAICLVLAGVMSISWWRQERGLNKPKQKIVRATDPRIEELEMELKKHNDVLAEIEKLLDGNLANVNPAKHAELVAERDRLLAERDELAAAIAAMKTENDELVDKVVETEAERDAYKKQLDTISQGASAFETRIEELLAKIADQEAEIERRDAVVIKMAEKYQLVEKDEFAEGLEAQAQPEDTTLAFITPEEPKKD
jgi:chromosome segregation ATPase